jgi:hypothetical protein
LTGLFAARLACSRTDIGAALSWRFLPSALPVLSVLAGLVALDLVGFDDLLVATVVLIVL